MADTIESLETELDQQKASNVKLANLLNMVKRGIPDPDRRVNHMIDEVRRTKEVLDDAERLLDEKRRNRPTE